MLEEGVITVWEEMKQLEQFDDWPCMRYMTWCLCMITYCNFVIFISWPCMNACMSAFILNIQFQLNACILEYVAHTVCWCYSSQCQEAAIRLRNTLNTMCYNVLPCCNLQLFLVQFAKFVLVSYCFCTCVHKTAANQAGFVQQLYN